MFDLQAIWQSISKYLADNKGLIEILLIISGGFSFSGVIGFMWWYRNQKRKRKFPPATPSPFEIIRPYSDVLSVVFPGDRQDPLADASIRYQPRCPTKQISVRQELIQQLNESNWLLIEGRTGLGKTREAGELADYFNREGWTVLWLKLGEWVDEPTREHLTELNTNRKLLFFLDDLNQRMYFGSKRKSIRAENSPLEPLTEPLQTRLLRTLKTYEEFCGSEEIKVIATARNEKLSDDPSKPSAWDKLEKDKYPKLWQRFKVYELPEPEDEAISQLLRETIPKTGIFAQEEDYLPIARKNDRTFRNPVENMVRLRNQGLPLTPNNYRDTLKNNWDRKYQDAVKRYPIAAFVYDAVDLLQQLEITLTTEIIRLTALLILNSKPWQVQHRYAVNKVLNYLIEAERILNPRDGQIEARERKIETKKYLKRLTKLVLGLTEEKLDPFSLHNLAFNLNQYNYHREALACINKLLKHFPHRSGTLFIWLFRGNVLDDLNRYEEALDSYDKALEFKPDLEQAWNNRGVVLGKLNCYEEALDSYDKALEFKSDNYQVWNNRGIALWKLNRHEEALDSYDKAIEFKPDYHSAWYNRGIVLGKLNRYEEAIESYDKALEFKPNNDKAWYNRGIVLRKLNRHEEALDSYDKAIEFKPDDHSAWNNRGIVLENLNRYKEALESYDKAIEFKPDDHSAWNNRGIVLENLNRYKEALESYDKAIEFKPDYHSAWNNRGIVLRKLNRYKEALDSYDKAIEFKPDYHSAWYNRGNVLENLNRHADALESYVKAIEFKLDDN